MERGRRRAFTASLQEEGQTILCVHQNISHDLNVYFQSTEVFHHGHHTAHARNPVVAVPRRKLELAQILHQQMVEEAVQVQVEVLHHATPIDVQVKFVFFTDCL